MPIINVTNDDGSRTKAINSACEALRAGGLLGLPTETVYGLAADANNGLAVAEIFAVKGRPQFNPLIVHVNGVEMAQKIGEFSPNAMKLAEKYWPGPLTIVVPKKDEAAIHELACAGQSTIAIRHPAGIASYLVEAFGSPLVAPSANKSGRISPTSAEHVQTEFGQDLLILDAGKSDLGIESTIVEVGIDDVTILRAGSITDAMLKEALGTNVSFNKGLSIKAPGMMKSHYAPNCALAMNCTSPAPDAALLAFGNPIRGQWKATENLSCSSDLVEAASNLYGALRKLDALKPSLICVMPIPNQGIGVAINDRLQRAAAPKQ